MDAFATHEVFNQSSPFVGINPYAADPALAEAVRLAGEAGRILAARSGEDADLDRALTTVLTGTSGREPALAVLAA